MQFRALVPENCKEGESLRVQISDGTTAKVAIPNGIMAGDSFLFNIPTNQLNDPNSLKEELQKQSGKNSNKQQNELKSQQQEHLQKAIPIAQVETRPHSDDSTKTVVASLVTLEDSFSPDGTNEATATKGTKTTRSFHDREIIDWQDFVLALTVGLLVGLAIVFGFLIGILHATEAIYALNPIERPKSTIKQQQQHQNSGARLPKSGPSATT